MSAVVDGWTALGETDDGHWTGALSLSSVIRKYGIEGLFPAPPLAPPQIKKRFGEGKGSGKYGVMMAWRPFIGRVQIPITPLGGLVARRRATFLALLLW